ncbi:MAG TPA: nuclear transport factor 2 family protein [Gemmatimonadaceae bacterium]|jgi:ketosteroid isomerase-like protein|nr:nuclear transport factor 2 family protein [Gemmatimonadaceae bacterium]
MPPVSRLLPILGSIVLMAGCGKSAAPTADSAGSPAAQSNFDENAARRQIIAADSAFVRAIASKNVDSLMIYYDPSVVSLGKTVVSGTDNVRRTYTEVVKNPPTNVNFQSGGVNFSDDHSMAWDYGTVSQTATVNGKPVRTSGTYLNVWKNVGGQWKIVAEISGTSP